MRRLFKLLILCLVPALTMTGCWSYRSLGDISIVMGMSLDRNAENGNFAVSCELVDLSGSIKESGPKGKIVESEGRTVFDAVRNAKRRMTNKPYFGNAQIVVIGEDLARTEGISDIVDWIMRDAECRETMNLVISQAGSAAELLASKGIDQGIVSLEIDSIISEDANVVAATTHTEVYNAFDVLGGSGKSLTLPAFHLAPNGDQPVIEANGVAAFKGDRLIGFLTPGETKFFLLATGECQGGILALALDGFGAPDISLEIAECEAKPSFSYKDGRLSFRLETESTVYLAEKMAAIDILDQEQIKALEEEAGKRLELEIGTLIRKIQTEFKTDILGFGHIIHMYDYPLWMQLESNWDQTFETLPVEVSCEVHIVNTAFIKCEEAIKK